MPYSDKDFKESNVNYINKDFSSLKNSLVQYAKTYFPNSYRDFNETSPGMMLIEMSAYVGDVLSFYIDQQYREMMLPLAEERRNVINMAKMLGYKAKPIVPAYVNLKFTQVVDADVVDASRPNYSQASTFDKGVKVTATTDSEVIFETLEEADFTVSGAIDPEVNSTNSTSGVVTDWKLTRTIKAISGETKTKTFDVTAPSKFLKLTLSDTNIIEIISIMDLNNNRWYEVDYLAQDKVPIETHYSVDSTRTDNLGNQNAGIDQGQAGISLQVPYSLEYIQTNKRFITEVNDNDTTSIIFGNGILNNGASLASSFLDFEQSGITIPGQTTDLDGYVDPLLGDGYASLGEAPAHTTLTVTYRAGGGITANVPSGDITTISGTPSVISGDSSGTINSVTNELPAVGGKGKDTVDEIRQRSMAFFSTQNRCVTKEDYEARILSLPSKFGNIAKVYVTRTDVNNDGLLALDEYTLSEIGGLGDYITNVTELITLINTGGSLEEIIADVALGGFTAPDLGTDISANFGTISIYILVYDNNKNLIGDPRTNSDNYSPASNGTSIPTLLAQNIKTHLEPFKVLTDFIQIKDGHIINFGVFFDVVAHKHANKKQVKFNCIQKIIDYFNIDKMQFRQPIYISQLESELMDVDGVRWVNSVTITQENDYLVEGGGGQTFSPFLYSHSIDGNAIVNEDNTGNGQIGYGYLYNFSNALSEGIILPSEDPAVFELKNPKQNIKGVVK